MTRIGFPFEPGKPPKIYRAVGCKRCGGIGYRGRMGIVEVFTMSEDDRAADRRPTRRRT